MQLNLAPRSAVLCELLEHIRKMFKSEFLNFMCASIHKEATQICTNTSVELVRKCRISAQFICHLYNWNSQYTPLCRKQWQFFHFQGTSVTINNCLEKFSVSGVGKGSKIKLIFTLLIIGIRCWSIPTCSHYLWVRSVHFLD